MVRITIRIVEIAIMIEMIRGIRGIMIDKRGVLIVIVVIVIMTKRSLVIAVIVMIIWRGKV